MDGRTFFHGTSVEQLPPVGFRGHWVKVEPSGKMPFNPGDDESLEN